MGNWVDPADLEPVIEKQAQVYYRKFATRFIGDEEDLQQAARLALWQLLKEKGNPDRVRELEALGVISNAIRDEIQATKRSGALCLGSQDVLWRLLTVRDRALTEGQQDVLDRFRMAVSQIAKVPNWAMMWLVLGCGWEPEDCTRYWRAKKDDRHFYSPEEVRERVEKAKRKVLERLNPDFLEELNGVSQIWW